MSFAKVTRTCCSINAMAFLRKIAIVSFAQIVGHVFTLLTGIILSRVMGPEGIGQLEVFKSFQSIIVTLFALGIGNASIYFINNVRIRTDELLATTLRASGVAAVFLLLTVLTIVYAFPNYFGPIAILSMVAYAAGTSFSLLILTTKTVLTAEMAAKKMVTIEQLPKLISVIATSSGWLLGIISVKFGIYTIALGNACALFMLIFFLQKHINFRHKFSKSLFKKVVGYGLKLSACDILFIVNANISVIMLKYFHSNNFSDIGIYSRAVAISSMVSLIPYTIGPLLYAKLATKSSEHLIGVTQYAIRVTLFLSIIVSLFVYLFRSEIILVLYGRRFIAAEMVIKVLAGSLVFYCVSNVCLNFLAGQGRATLNMKILLFSFITISAITYLGIKAGGIQGAAFGILVGNIVTASASLFFCQKYFGLRINQSLIIRSEDFSSLLRSVRLQK